MEAHMEAKRIRVRGRVQGVGYRWFTRDAASALGVRGWVRNEPDGSVSAHVEGDHEALDALISRMRRGPTFGRVDALETEEAETAGHDAFSIKS
jgi:acylphosphatase